ncbi:glycosyltransferase [Photobacterium phosphoreum]|uniref:glycosyltransferase family 2 protein n=1 Tax=Photobacterium phosphoreum TaxID=659 RepID=UPI001E4D1508|nr:glycosyltransferase family 2 protein [Photobacterium phosphoreum]MCD9504140.1 glycosyltransferase [Photobacterium phosphoreum]
MVIVSIIVPIFNAEKYLEKTIESVISQSYKDFELILVDDGSVDSSLDICRNFSECDSRVLTLAQENMGVSSARNKGLKQAKGKWVYFLDSDDTLDVNCLEECSHFFDSGVDVIQFGSRRIKDSKVTSYRNTLCQGKNKITNGFSEFIDNSKIGALCVWLHLINYELIRDKGILFSDDMNNNEDMLFMYKVLVSSKRQVFIGNILHTQYLVENSLSRSPLTKLKINNRLLLVQRVFDLIKDNAIYNDKIQFEGNKLLKWYFGSLLEFSNQYRCDFREFNDDYKIFFNEYSYLLNTKFSILGRVDVRLVVFMLKLKQNIRSCLFGIT